MKSKKIIIILFVCFNLNLIYQYDSFAANNKIVISGFGKFFQDIQIPLQSKQLNMINNIQKPFGNSFALALALGNHISSIHLDDVEISLGAKLTLTEKFNIEDKKIFTFGASPKIEVGLPGSVFSDEIEDLDFIIRIFYITLSSSNNFQSFSSFSIGLIPRFNFVDKVSGRIAGWHGLTFALGFDYMNLNMAIGSNNKIKFGNFDLKGASNQIYSIKTKNFNISLDSDIFTINPEIITGANLWIFNLLFGTGLALDLGKIKFNTQFEAEASSKLTSQVELGKNELIVEDGGKILLPYYRVAFAIRTGLLNLTANYSQAFAEKLTYAFGFGISVEF